MMTVCRKRGDRRHCVPGCRVSIPFNLLFLLLLPSMLVPACGTGRDSDDVTRETLSSGLIRTTWHRLPQIRLELDTLAVWDIWDESAGYVFGDIKAASGSPEGFYLVDAGTRQIVLVDRQGDVRQTFGNQGTGPGEFQYPLQIFTRDDEIWVGDLVSRRYSVFDREGVFMRGHPWSGSGRLNNEGFAITPAGGELYMTQSVNGFRALLHSLPEGAAADTIAVMHTHPASGVTINIPGLGPVTMYDPPAYSPELHWTWEPDGRILTVTSTEYRIDHRDLSGRVLQELVTPTPDLTVTAADREAFMIRLARSFDSSIAEFRRSNPRFESQYPFAEKRTAIERITIDPLGRIWVLANTPGDTGQRIDLFDRDFAYLGSLRDLPLPEAFMPGGEALFRIADDDTGADLFFVARIEV
jgi:hypothetical protein